MSDKKEFGPIFGRTPRYLTEEQLRDALKLSWDTPGVQGILGVLDAAIEMAATQAGNPDLAEQLGPLAHTCGGLEWLRFLRADLERFNPGGAK